MPCRAPTSRGNECSEALLQDPTPATAPTRTTPPERGGDRGKHRHRHRQGCRRRHGRRHRRGHGHSHGLGHGPGHGHGHGRGHGHSQGHGSRTRPQARAPARPRFRARTRSRSPPPPGTFHPDRVGGGRSFDSVVLCTTPLRMTFGDANAGIRCLMSSRPSERTRPHLCHPDRASTASERRDLPRSRRAPGPKAPGSPGRSLDFAASGRSARDNTKGDGAAPLGMTGGWKGDCPLLRALCVFCERCSWLDGGGGRGLSQRSQRSQRRDGPRDWECPLLFTDPDTDPDTVTVTDSVHVAGVVWVRGRASHRDRGRDGDRDRDRAPRSASAAGRHTGIPAGGSSPCRPLSRCPRPQPPPLSGLHTSRRGHAAASPA